MRVSLVKTRCALFAVFAALGAIPAFAQNYPDRVIRIITTPAGSGRDFAALLISQALSRTFAPQVIVDNRGNNAAEIVIKSPADGYTLLCWGSPVWLTQFLLENLSWEPERDLAPITSLTTSPNILVVHPSLPVRSVKELIALARARPGVLNYTDTVPDRCAEELRRVLLKHV